jgi:formate dehydrogenase subunit gamma
VARLVAFHEAAALALLGLPALVWLSGQTARTAADLREALRWSRDDWRWLRLQPAAILGRAELPPVAKLNAGQKLNSLAIALLCAGLVASGGVLWLRPGSLAAWFVHLSLFALWIPLFLGHMALAFVVPATRPALRGMVLGRVSRAWAEHHHPLWARGPRAAHDSPPRPRCDGAS